MSRQRIIVLALILLILAAALLSGCGPENPNWCTESTDHGTVRVVACHTPVPPTPIATPSPTDDCSAFGAPWLPPRCATVQP